MIDFVYYTNLLMGKDAGKVLKFFGHKQFDDLNKAQFFFKNQSIEKVSWIKEEDIREKMSALCLTFSERLDEQQLSLEDKQALVLEHCDKDASQFSFLEYKGSGMTTTCRCPNPNCSEAKPNEKCAWIPEKGSAKSVVCNHRTNCGFSGDFIAVYAAYYGLTYGKALLTLADEFGIDFTINEVHIGERVSTKKENPILVPVAPVEVEISYMVFDKTKKYQEINFLDYLDSYEKMTEKQKFQMLATAIYKFSLSTKQWGKTKYFKSVGIDVKSNPILKEKVEAVDKHLGFLHASDLPDLINHLTEYFPIEDLVEFGVIHRDKKADGTPHPFPYSFKQSVEEGLVVIPNFDLYTNMCTGLKYRKTKLKTWIDKKTDTEKTDSNKEPEFSHGRIADPLPYHLTREALLDESISFRFFEGQKDLHSMPLKKSFCDIAIPGVNGISVEMLGLFKGRVIELYFDQDEAGQAGALKLKLLLEEAGATVLNKTWDVILGSDVNDVLLSGNIEKI